MTRDELVAIQARVADDLLRGDDRAARMVRGKRIEGLKRWMPATAEILRHAGWLEPLVRDFATTRAVEGVDLYAEARLFENFLRTRDLLLDGLDDALDEDSARMELLAPGARPWGAVRRGCRVFYRKGDKIGAFGLPEFLTGAQ